jgi:hypothetical protein
MFAQSQIIGILRLMKLVEVIFFSLAVAFIIIGIHQVMTVGFANGYWALMLALLFFFLYNLRKQKKS